MKSIKVKIYKVTCRSLKRQLNLTTWRKYSIHCLVAQLCLTVCDPMDCSPSAPLSMGILQASILEWVAMPSSRASSQPRDQTQVSCIAGGFFTVWATKEVLYSIWSDSKFNRILWRDRLRVEGERKDINYTTETFLCLCRYLICSLLGLKSYCSTLTLQN